MKDIQALINREAEKIVDQKLKDLYQTLHNSGILEIKQNIRVSLEGQEQTLREALWSPHEKIGKFLKHDLLKKEIEIQSKLFFNKVKEMGSFLENNKGKYL